MKQQAFLQRCERIDVLDVLRAAGNFALGGHSLLALKMMQQLPMDEAHKPPLATIFSAPRLSEFAVVVSMARNRASEQYSSALG